MKSYHFLDVINFNLFNDRPEEHVITTSAQLATDGTDDQPSSSMKLIRRNYYKGFDKYIIHHEKIKRKRGRAYGEDLFFDSFVETTSMSAYFSPQLKLLIIEGNKGSVNDFVRKFNKEFSDDLFKVTRSNVNFPHFIRHTENVWGGWLNGFNDGNLKSVALYGNRVNLSEDYNRFEAAGKLSSLNCSITFEKESYDFMITANKTVVIMQNRTHEEDLDLLLFIKPMLYNEPVTT